LFDKALAIQGLFLGALAFVWDGESAKSLIDVFFGLGVLVSIISWEGLDVSKKAQHKLRDEWDSFRDKAPLYQGPDVVGYRSPEGEYRKYLRPWRSMPAVFILAWILIETLNRFPL